MGEAVAAGGEAMEDVAFEQDLGPAVGRGQEAGAGRFDFGHGLQRGQLDVQAGGQLFPGLFACRALEFGVHAGMPPLGDDNGDNGLCA